MPEPRAFVTDTHPLVLHAAGGKGLGRRAAECFAASSTCPAGDEGGKGMVAIVLDDVVLSAPSINATGFERDQIQISGEFDETSALALAAVLDGGATATAWTVRD